MIIFVCGTSSVGKSSVCHNLKKSLPANWLSFSMDGYLAMLGDKFLELHPKNPEVTTPSEVCYAHQHEDGTYEIVSGKLCKKLFSTIPHVLQIMAQQGFSIIVDSLITKKSELMTFKEELEDSNCVFIYLNASEESIIQREEARGDRLKGSAIHWLRSFDFKDNCDLSINTDEIGAEDIAKQILEELRILKK